MTDATNSSIRIYHRATDGTLDDGAEDFDIASFGGVVPSIGDTILNPGVPVPLDRRDFNNREVWKVVDRWFNPRDLPSYVALVVETRKMTELEDRLN